MGDLILKTDEQQEKWDGYLLASGRAKAFHYWGWKNVFNSVFGLQTRFLSTSRNGKVTGVLPLLLVRSPFFGNYLTSLPGGISADDPESEALLLNSAIEIVQENDLQHLALRDGTHKIEHPDLVTDLSHVSMQVSMSGGLEEVQSRVNGKTRQKAKKALRDSLYLDTGMKYLSGYYTIHQGAMRERGTPTQGIGFFKRIAEEFPEDFHLMVVKKEEKILGGGFYFLLNGVLVCTWSGMLREYLPLGSNYLMLWETLKLAEQAELDSIDLGRSQENSGTFEHKKRWGAVPVQLYQQYYLHKASSAGVTGNSRNQTRVFKTFVAVWGRLPLPVTEFLGPKLRRQVPFG